MNLWSLWKSRTLRIWDNISETCQVISATARQLLYEWREANKLQLISGVAGVVADSGAAVSVDSAGAQQLLPAQIRWVKPQQGRIKCNIDATFSEALNRVGFGMCLRDAAGNFLRAKMMWSNPMCTPEVGKRWDYFMLFNRYKNYNLQM